HGSGVADARRRALADRGPQGGAAAGGARTRGGCRARWRPPRPPRSGGSRAGEERACRPRGQIAQAGQTEEGGASQAHRFLMIRIVGGGLAGSEAAWQAASRGVPVFLHEMRPVRPTAVHKTDCLAELVCSNSFRGDKLDNAVGLLKEEMRRLGSLVMRAADASRVPAGGGLAGGRERLAGAGSRGRAWHPLVPPARV